MNRNIIQYVIGKLIQVEACLLILPLLVAFIYGESMQHISAFGLVIIGSGILGSYLTRKPVNATLRAREGAVIVGLGWIILSFIGGLPFVLSGDIPSIVDAFFETSSGLTTTGSSILTKLAPLSHSSLFWRSFTHLIGGMGILVFTLAVLPNIKSHDAQLLRAEVPGPVFGKIVSRLADSARILYAIYITMTIIFVFILIVGGVPIFDAFLLAFGTAGTGGFAINDLGFSIYSNPVFVEYAIAIGMLLFGVNFNLYYFILIRKIRAFFSDEELKWYFSIVCITVILILCNLASVITVNESTFRNVLFTVSSVITTTGYATADFAQWPLFSQVLLVMLMFFGGSAGSTAGGIKVARIAIYCKQAVAELFRIGNPNRIVSVRLNRKAIKEAELTKLNNYLLVYIVVFFGIFLSVSFEMKTFLDAFTAVAATFNNIGPGLGAVGPTQNFAFLSDFNKVILSLGMIAGRLEIYPILITFAPSTIKKILQTNSN